jgi:hypothetical protein
LKLNKILAWMVVIALNGGLLLFYHNRFWWGADDGLYAHLSERVLHGEILHKDVTCLCPGFEIFVNAAALRLFGEDFVSLRYPLVLVSFLQSCLIFVLFARHHLVTAVIAAVLSTALGVLHFLNPTHHWYVLFLAVLTGCYLTWSEDGPVRKYFWAGFLIAVIFCFRQPTAVLVAMAVVGCALLERHNGTGQRGSLAVVLCGSMALFLLLYLWKATDAVSFLIFGFWPLCILLWFTFKVRVPNSGVLNVLAALAGGGIVALIPLLVYHGIHHSLPMFISDTVNRAGSSLGQNYFSVFSYGQIPQSIQLLLTQSSGPLDLLNAAYWLILLAVPFLSGAACFYGLTRGEKTAYLTFPMIAVFYGLVSVHFAIPIYLYFSVGFCLVALLWLLIVVFRISAPRTVVLLAVCSILGTFAVMFHAAKSVGGNMVSTVGRNSTALVFAGERIPRLSLWIDPKDLQTYSALLEVIGRHTRRSDTIWAVPFNPEIYFLSGRKNPFPFFNIETALYKPEDAAGIIRKIRQEPPALICYFPRDKRRTAVIEAVMNDVRAHYRFYGDVAGFEIYLR